MSDEPRVARVTMLDCIDCHMLETRIVAASQRENRLVHEVERLGEAAEQARRALDASAIKRRHWIRLFCDRCGSAVEISSTLEMGNGRRCTAMLSTALALGWTLSDATHAELGGDGTLFKSKMDLCRVCGEALQDGTKR